MYIYIYIQFFVLLLANEGGWDDEKAVQGSLRLAAQCVTMGGNWCMKHPQTRRMLFLELNFQWCEQMSTSWTTFKKLATPDELDELDENLQGPAAATQEVQGLAAAGQRRGQQQALPTTPVVKTAASGKAQGKAVVKQNTAGTTAEAVGTTPQTTEEKSKAEFNKLWSDGARLRFHHDINRVSCTYIYTYMNI